MDGPKLNLKFYRKIEGKNTEFFYQSLIDVETCSLHSVHGAVKSGIESTSWGTKDILKGRFTLLHDLPARREDFPVVVKSNVCTHYTIVPLDGWKRSVLQIGR